MSNLINIQDGQAVTTSRRVADNFGRLHKDVLENIREIIKAGNSAVTNMFFETTYKAGTGRRYPEYFMNRDGFTLLAMGFTGSDAMEWKIKYIQAFNEMEKQFNQVPQTLSAALRLAADQADIIEQQSKLLITQKPQVMFAEAVSTSKDSILIGEMAKILKQRGIDIGQNRFFEWLRENGYLGRKLGANYNLPTQKSMDLGLFEIKKTAITRTDGVHISRTPKVTGTGQIYFVNKLLNKPIAI